MVKVTYVAVKGKRNMIYCTCLFFILRATRFQPMVGGAGLLRRDQKGCQNLKQSIFHKEFYDLA